MKVINIGDKTKYIDNNGMEIKNLLNLVKYICHEQFEGIIKLDASEGYIYQLNGTEITLHAINRLNNCIEYWNEIEVINNIKAIKNDLSYCNEELSKIKFKLNINLDIL